MLDEDPTSAATAMNSPGSFNAVAAASFADRSVGPLSSLAQAAGTVPFLPTATPTCVLGIVGVMYHLADNTELTIARYPIEPLESICAELEASAYRLTRDLCNAG